jgi:hypothetical protein
MCPGWKKEEEDRHRRNRRRREEEGAATPATDMPPQLTCARRASSVERAAVERSESSVPRRGRRWKGSAIADPS